MSPRAFASIFLPSEALAIKDMHPSTYHPYLWLWDENMKKVTASARYLNGVLRWMERKARRSACKLAQLVG